MSRHLRFTELLAGRHVAYRLAGRAQVSRSASRSRQVLVASVCHSFATCLLLRFC
jgi:hypothetical protein